MLLRESASKELEMGVPYQNRILSLISQRRPGKLRHEKVRIPNSAMLPWMR